MSATLVEVTREQVSQLDRQATIMLLMSLECDFPIDFTDEFFATRTTAALRHILMGTLPRAHNVLFKAG